MMLSANSSSISTFTNQTSSTSTSASFHAGGRRSRFSNSLLRGGKGSEMERLSAATPTSTKYMPSTSMSFEDPTLRSECTTPDTNVDNAGATDGAGNPTSSCSRRVFVSDHELRFRAGQVSRSLDFDALTDLARNRWTWKENRREFTLFTMNSEAERRHEVLAAGDINCSIEELASVLHLSGVAEYNASMKRLLKKEFIYGSIVHVTGSEALQAQQQQPGGQLSQQPVVSPGGLDASFHVSSASSVASSSASSSSKLDNYVAVKTGTFVRSSLFARNEEWCFLESFERSADGDNFLLSQSTMDAAEIAAGKASHSRVEQLRDVTTAFYVEKIPRSRAVRVFFHGKYDGGLHSFIETKGVAPPKAAKARLMMLAKSTSRISDLVRRRRLGLQKMANRTAFNAIKNTRCTCCTKSLHLFTKKKRCFLCAYYVCDKCWSQQKMETCNGKTSAILICTRCLESVDACEYSDVCSRDRSKQQHLIRVEPDDGDRNRRNQEGGTPSEPAGKALVDILEQSLGDSDEVIKLAAMSVIRHILKLDSPTTVDLTGSFTANPREAEVFRRGSDNLGLQSERDHVEALARNFELEPQTPIEECVLANADSRNYPIRVPQNPTTTAPEYPLPGNETERMRAIHENNFLDLGEVAELNIICALAAEELHCAISMITIIDDESELVLACNNLDLHRTRMARNQTFCSHLIMDNKPLLIRNPEADVRFFNMDAVKQSGVKFYCGFPISARDGTVVGSVCCLDFEQRKLTQSQYAMMKKLAKTASKVIQTKGRVISLRKTLGLSPP